MAVVTADIKLTGCGGAPVLVGRDEEECEKMAGSLSRILDAVAHRLENGLYIIVSH